MVRTFKYRLYPTRRQGKLLCSVLDECRWLYNHLLEKRISVYKDTGKGLSYYEQTKYSKELKSVRPSLLAVHAQAIQNVAMRLDLTFKAFFRRVKNGEVPGFPRFKCFDRYDSFTFPQIPNGCRIKDGKVEISKVGAVKAVLDRPLEGKPKTATVIRSKTGKWYVSFDCEVEREKLPEVEAKTGIDVGLKSFATFSDGSSVPAPKCFRHSEKHLAQKQRQFSKTTKGSYECKLKRRCVAKVHEKIANRREDFAHQLSRKVINENQIICVEDIETNKLVHNHCLAKSIRDAAWSQFFNFLSYKAEEAGRTLVKVNPAYTSQTCSSCGHRQKLTLDIREYVCPCCGLRLDRDHNAALNILALGLHSVGIQPVNVTASAEK